MTTISEALRQSRELDARADNLDDDTYDAARSTLDGRLLAAEPQDMTEAAALLGFAAEFVEDAHPGLAALLDRCRLVAQGA